MINNPIGKTLALGIIFIIIGGLFVPCSQSALKQMQKNQLSTIEQTDVSTEEATITCYTFGGTGNGKRDVVLSTDEATLIFQRLKQLESEMTINPDSKDTQSLKTAFINMLDEKELLSNKFSKEVYLSLLTPRWVERLQNSKNKGLLPQPFGSRGTSALCSIGGGGTGILIPLFLLPRPRLAMMWMGTGVTTATSLITTRGYVAEGAQTGFTLGFMGIGITYAIPGYMLYGFIGYALLASTTAGYVVHYPPNRAPEISDVLPVDGTHDVPLTQSKLQFRIQDPDGDLMSYRVTTEPDIGSDSGNLKPFGVYTVPVSGLQNDIIYHWTLEVSDGKEKVIQTYSFITQGKPPFNPFAEGWNYRKQITINHTLVSGELTDVPVFIGIIDQDLRDKTQVDGDDILFMDGAGVATKLYHEIDSYNGATGQLTAWITMPMLSSIEDTVFYMYYGNPSSTAQQFPEKAWASHFKAVWHLNKNPAMGALDSTANNNDLTVYGSMSSSSIIDGRVGKALQFDGIDDYLVAPDSLSLKPTELTLMCWLNIATEYTNEEGREFILGKRCADSHGNQDAVTYGIQYNNDMGTRAEKDDNSQTFARYNATLGTWYHTVMTFDSSTKNIQYYQDGILRDSANHGQSLRYTSPWEFIMAAGHIHEGSNLNYWVNCKIDEVWIADIDLTSGWISTVFENQNNPTGFLSFGTEESHP